MRRAYKYRVMDKCGSGFWLEISAQKATMIYTCVMAGLRVSELVGLKWEDVHRDSLTIDERFSRGEWGCPKTTASTATIGVDERVIQRINRLKDRLSSWFARRP